MHKDRLLNLANNPELISGIYNFCDRWCERCLFTSRCMNYALGEDHFSDPESQDIHGKLVWKKYGELLRLTLLLIKESAEKHGINTEKAGGEEPTKEELDNHKKTENHVCSQSSIEYGKMTERWFESTKELFEKNKDEPDSESSSRFTSKGLSEEDSKVDNAVQVIRWYQHHVCWKTLRAIHMSLLEKNNTSYNEQNDSDGSAKVALIAIDRSIAAWKALCKGFPEQVDNILDILWHLDKLRVNLEISFPKARLFVRPGFDEYQVHAAHK